MNLKSEILKFYPLSLNITPPTVHYPCTRYTKYEIPRQSFSRYIEAKNVMDKKKVLPVK